MIQSTCATEQVGSLAAMQAAIYRVVVQTDHALREGLDQRCADLAALITSTRRTMPDTVAGMIAFHRGCFHLAFEGPQGDVEATQDRITHAFEHLVVRVLFQGHVPVRRLPRHAMLFISGDPLAQSRFSEALDQSGPEAGFGDAEAVVEALVLATSDQRLRTSAMAEAVGPSSDHTHAPVAADRPASSCSSQDRTDIPSTCAEAEAIDATFGSAVVSADRIFLRTNPYFADLFRYQAEELTGLPYTCTLNESDDTHLDRLWATMERGETVRIDRRGRRRDGIDIWLRSTYRPRLDEAARLRDVTEITVEITPEKLRQLDERGQITAINRAQAVVHFDLDGVVTEANDLFLSITGYTRPEVIGRHHRMFVEPGEADGPEYAAFWQSFAAGHPRSAEFRRIAKGGYPVWLQATYNPILDMAGRPFKVVKYATDVTAEKLLVVPHRSGPP